MRKAAFSLIALLALSWPFVAPWVQAQTFTVLYSFTGGADGSSPVPLLKEVQVRIVSWAAELCSSWIPGATRLCCIPSRTHPMVNPATPDDKPLDPTTPLPPGPKGPALPESPQTPKGAFGLKPLGGSIIPCDWWHVDLLRN